MKRIHFQNISSTHKYAKKLTFSSPSNIILLTSDFQSEGIGTKGKKWIAKKKSSLLLSMIFPAPKMQFFPYLSKIAGVSIIKTLQKLSIDPSFKDPNDIMIDNKKVCGILSEINNQYVISSLGLNLTQSKKDLSLINQSATSLFLETNSIYSNEEILSIYIPILFSNLQIILPNHRQHFNLAMNFSF